MGFQLELILDRCRESSDAAKSSGPLSSPLSTQDLNSGTSHDMPVSSSEFSSWTSDMTHSITPSSLDNWTHFGGSNSRHPSDGGSEILKELLKEEPGSDPSDAGNHDALLKLLNEKPHGERNVTLTLYLI